MPITRTWTINPTTGRLEVSATGEYGSGGAVSDEDLLAIADLATTSYGRGLLELANAGALLTAAGAQPSDSDLTSIAALATTSYGRSILTLADGAALLAAAGAQVSDSDLTSIAALATTSYGRGLLTLADQAALQAAVGAVAGRVAHDEANNASLTIDADDYDQYALTAMSAATTINAPTGTLADGQRLVIRLKDNGTARALTWNAIFRAIGVTLPTTTVLGKTHYIGCIYNVAATKWDAVAVVAEA